MNSLYDNDLKLSGDDSILMGVDEAGRGALAGPVLCAAVILDYNVPIPGLDDSKKLNAKKRELLFDQIVSSSLAYSIISVTPAYIDAYNILRATMDGMWRAMQEIETLGSLCLIDGPHLPKPDLEISEDKAFEYVTGQQRHVSGKAEQIQMRAVIDGDARHACIAAASILAKVARDRIMTQYHEVYPHYGFDRHKGYGTALHLAALKEHGACPIHRQSFAPVSRLGQMSLL